MFRFLLGFLAFLLAAALSVGADAASRGISVELKASEAPGAPSAGKVQLYSASHALVIGNDRYRNRAWGRLSNGVNDAKRMAEALEARGFDVTLETDLNSAQLRKAFKDFFIAKGREENARLFVWYAGHGATVDGEGYLIPTDGVAPADEVGFLNSAVSLRDFGTFVRYAKSKHVFTVFDSCFAGTIFNVARSAIPPAITRVTAEPVRQFLSSGDAGQEVSDDGTFAKLFIEALEGRSRADANGDGYLTGSEIGAHVTYRLSNATSNRQTPRSGKLRSTKFDKGDFVFQLAALGAAPKAPAPSAGGGNAEVVFWQSVEDSTDASMFEEYLRVYPNGKFAGLARLKVGKLKGRQTASLTPPTQLISSLDETYVVIKTANIRAKPDAKSGKVTTLGVDTGIQVTGKTSDGKWLRIAHGGKDAFIWGRLVKSIDAGEQSAWGKIKDSRSKSAIEGFLSDYPSGHYSGRAERLVAALTPLPKAAVPTPRPSPSVQPAVGVYLRPGKTFRDCADCPEMVVVPAGSFRMGDLSGGGDSDETPVHQVTIPRAFAVGKYEVTQAEWRSVMGNNPSQFKGDRNPVEKVSWKDAKNFVRKLSDKTGKQYRLLSESEWEYAARAGTTTKWHCGSGEGCVSGVAWHLSNSGKTTHAVGGKQPNGFGLYDMHGNVWEWTEDCWNANYIGAPDDGEANATGDCTLRVLRGGSWDYVPWILRAADRGGGNTSKRNSNVGFRIARTL